MYLSSIKYLTLYSISKYKIYSITIGIWPCVTKFQTACKCIFQLANYSENVLPEKWPAYSETSNGRLLEKHQ